MLTQKTKLVFDFDGVICDSIKECYFTAFHLYYKINDIKSFSIFYKKNFLKLKKLRVFVKSGLDYFVAIYILDKKLIIKNKKDFESAKVILDISENKINKLFYRYRKEFVKKNYILWIAMNPLYKGLKKILIKLIKENILYVLTYKNKESVLDILNHNKIFIQKENVISLPYTKSKKMFFKKNNKYIFIDDNISNLLDIDTINVKKYLAKWGYNSNSEISLAKKNKINILSINKIRNLI